MPGSAPWTLATPRTRQPGFRPHRLRRGTTIPPSQRGNAGHRRLAVASRPSSRSRLTPCIERFGPSLPGAPGPRDPTRPAWYPVSVRQVRVLGLRAPALVALSPSDSISRWTPWPALAVPTISARRGLPPPTRITCLANKKKAAPAEADAAYCCFPIRKANLPNQSAVRRIGKLTGCPSNATHP